MLKQTQKAYLRYNPKSLVVGGGVACNNYLRDKMTEMIPGAIFVPPVLCTDNAAMIGALAYKMYQHNIFTDPLELKADSSLEEI